MERPRGTLVTSLSYIPRKHNAAILPKSFNQESLQQLNQLTTRSGVRAGGRSSL